MSDTYSTIADSGLSALYVLASDVSLFSLLFIILFGYSTVKVVFANIKRGGISVCAEPQLSTPVEGEFTEYYKYTSKIYNSMTISNKTASCKSTIMGFSDETTKVVVTHTLEKKSGNWWSNVTSWTKTFNTYAAIYSTSKSSLSSGTYRLKTVAKVYNGSDYETITIYSSTASC